MRHAGVAIEPHIICAGLIAALTGVAIRWVVRARHRALYQPAFQLGVLVLIQIALGLLTIRDRNQVLLTVAHVICGSLTLASACVLTILAFRGTRLPTLAQTPAVAKGFVA